MPVTCPHCNARYVLPESLLGPGGARVRCPKCRESFTVGPAGEAIIPLPAPAANGAATANPVRPEASAAVSSEEATGGDEALASLAAATAEPPTGPGAAAAMQPDVPAVAPAAELSDAAQEAPAGAVLETPAMVARQVLEDLASHSGPAIATSQSEGHLFREFGAVIAEAYDAYRLRVGSDADPAPFRAALRERWGVNLDPGASPKRLG